jgi:hypothetical protein
MAQKLAQPSPALCRYTPDKFPPRRLMLAKISCLDYCIFKQLLVDATVTPYEIEDTSDWLACPTRLETVKHYASMLEEDIHVLRFQLRAAKENISCLVEMNAQLTAELKKISGMDGKP